MSRSDGECIRLCLDGHPEAYEELVARYEAPVISYLAGRLGDADLAEEAAHEAFVRAYFALGRLRRPESFFSWLVGIADHAARDEMRLRRRQRGIDGTVAAAPAKAQEARFDIERAVGELGGTYRDVVLMRFFGGMSCAGIAERLNVSVGTVTKRLSRAYALLRKRLDKLNSDKEARG
jgi:RNA polymerase sigma-70 factor (ECF subfamily)